MNNSNPNTSNFQPNSRRETLENSKLSRLPKLPSRNLFTQNDAPQPAVVVVCAGCNARLDVDDPMQLTFSSCRKCLGIYTRVGTAVEETAKRKIKESLEKMGGVK